MNSHTAKASDGTYVSWIRFFWLQEWDQEFVCVQEPSGLWEVYDTSTGSVIHTFAHCPSSDEMRAAANAYYQETADLLASLGDDAPKLNRN